MDANLISIIIPTYNRAHLIGDTLDSVLAQTYTNWECIIVDDGSTDNTDEIVNKYVIKDGRFQYHKRPEYHRPGGNGARNYGARLSNSNFLIFLDSDDLLKENTLLNRMKYAVNSKKHFDLLINNTALFKFKIGDTDLLWNIYDKNDTIIDLLKKFLNNDMPWHTNGATWTKTFFNKIGGWNESLKSWQDWEIHIRALLSNPIIVSGDQKPDNFYKIEGSDSIKDKHYTLNYYKSVKFAFLLVSKELEKSFMFNKLENEYEKLAYRILISKPITNKFYLEAFRNFKDLITLKKNNIVVYFYFFLLEFLCQSSKIKKYFLKKHFEKYRDYINENKTFMKLSIRTLEN